MILVWNWRSLVKEIKENWLKIMMVIEISLKFAWLEISLVEDIGKGKYFKIEEKVKEFSKIEIMTEKYVEIEETMKKYIESEKTTLT